MRQEACQGLYRLCLGRTGDGQTTGYRYLVPMLAGMLASLDAAHAMKPTRKPVRLRAAILFVRRL